MNYKEIIHKAENHVCELFEAHQNDVFVYHNLEHTKEVVKVAGKIAEHYNLSTQDYYAVLLAAWFHDVGYLFGCDKGHEEKSAEVATLFLEEMKADPMLIENVREGILATKMFCNPPSLIAKILADADLFHLGTPDFKKTNKKVWIEMKRYFGKRIPAYVWQKGSLKLLERHQYHTKYCRELLQEGKQKNIDFLREWFEKNGVNSSTETDKRK